MERNRLPLDMYDLPPEMVEYFRHYGRNFNKKMYEFALSKMYKMKNGKKEAVPMVTKEQFDTVMNKYGIKLENDVMYNGVYVWSMASSDFLGSSIPDEQHLALFVKDYIDDPDQVDGHTFNIFYASCVLKGEPIDWEEML